MNIRVMCSSGNNVNARIIKRKLIEKGFNVVDSQADVVFIVGGQGPPQPPYRGVHPRQIVKM